MSTERNTKPLPRRLTARSVLLSVLLGSDPPRLPVALLVATTDLFGIAEGTTRTALSRMTAAGEVRARGAVYELVGTDLLARQERQTASRAGRTRQWDGGWTQAVSGAAGPRSAAERAQVRDDLRRRRFAELREGVWLRPDNHEATTAATTAPTGPDDVRWFRVVPAGDPVELAGRLWDLDAWARTADLLRARMAELIEPLEAGDRTRLADGFVLSADVLRHLQADPLLPEPLLPPGWPGAPLRTEYDAYDRAYRAVLRDWFVEAR